jgi:hypothetical protein
MSYKIIVARYNEDIQWLNDEMHNCIIYNKGEPLNIPNEILIENVGRESETYLHYIIDNYDKLPDVVVFTQARIGDHKGADDVNYLLRIKNDALEYSISKNLSIHYDNNTNIHFDKEWNLRTDGWFLKDNYKNNQPITFLEWFTKNINNTYPNPLIFYCNAIFALKKELILSNSIDYYKKLILEVNHHINSTEGHFFERSWYYIFTHFR